MRDERPEAFDTSHPVVPAVYLAGTTTIMMFALHPVYVGISLAAALALSAACRGVGATFKGLRWQLPMLALVCLANPVFSASGSTLLWHVGPVAVYAESLAYGACMGGLMVAVVVWLECAPRLLTQDELLAVGGRVLPTVSLMASMAAQLVPQLVRRGSVVQGTAAACTASRPRGADGSGGGRRAHVGEGAHVSTILMSWALEDSLERSDAMRARGWGATPRRTSYRTYRFHASDGIALACIAALLLADALLAGVACSQFDFYPTMPRLVAWWGYLPHVVLMALPTLLDLREKVAWR